MLLTSKQSKHYIYLMLMCCSGYLTKAMEHQTCGMEKEAEEQASSWTRLPQELKAYVITFLASAENKEKAIENIKALSITSRGFNTLINDPYVLGSLIREIGKQFDLSPVDVALAFCTPNVLDWLKYYVQEYVQEKKRLNQCLLRAAFRKSRRSRILFLLNAGADVNNANIDGYTSLHWAARKGDKDIVELLLKSGASVNQADKFGYIPLHCAAAYDHEDIVKLLLNAGSAINKVNNNGNTPLYLATLWDNKGLLELLLQHGAIQ
jgi:hypothetical protein